MNAAVPIEQELKIPVEDLGRVRTSLERRGAVRLAESRREVNLLFDDEAGTLASSQCALRLRRWGGSWRLTHKGPPVYIGQVKTRQELETGVADGGVLLAILERLGFRPVLRYEKDRETWRLDDVEVALDHTPMGDFVELEGPNNRLEAVAERLDLDATAAVRGSYVSLWRSYREAHPDLELPVHMVFRE